MDTDLVDNRGELEEDDKIPEVTPEENVTNSPAKPYPSATTVGPVTSSARHDADSDKNFEVSSLDKSGTLLEDERNRQGSGARNYGEDWDLLCYIKERDIARAETVKVKAELSVAQVKMYDMTKRIEKLERQLAVQHGSRSPTKSARKSKRTVPNGNILKIPDGNKAPSSSRKSPTRIRSPCPSPSRSPSRSHSPSPHRPKTPPNPPKLTSKKANKAHGKDENPQAAFYKVVAERFPYMPLSTALSAEEKFKAADINNDGTIDRDELDTVLMANNFLLTPDQIDSLLRELDMDNNQTVDITDVLTVLDKLEKRRKSPSVPLYIQEKKSQICAIQ